MKPTVMETVSGPVEVVVEGAGPPILYFHGTLSGIELAMSRDRSLADGGYQLIVPHRPGFYGTPLDGHTTTADSADLAAALLDRLGLARVAVIGTSAGGLPAMAFAIRHPQRTAALILNCAQCHCWDGPDWVPATHRWMYRWVRRAPTRWLFASVHARILRFTTVKQCLWNLTGRRFAELSNDTDAWQFAEVNYRELLRIKQHLSGYRNDLATFVSEDVLSTGRVGCPTMIFHDPLDPIAPFRHAEYAAQKIDGAELVRLHAGGHMIWVGRDAPLMQQRRAAFLREHLAGSQRAG